MSGKNLNTEDIIFRFVTSCGRDYEFPTGGKVEMLTSIELELLKRLLETEISDSEKIKLIGGERDWSDCYSIAIFGIRLAVFAVRVSNAELFSIGNLLLVAASPKIDWRDVLGALAIFEACGERLGIEFRREIERTVRYGDEAKLRPTIDGYFSRDREMREVKVMGFEQVGEGKELNFKPRYASY